MKGCVGYEVVLVGSWGKLPKLTHVLGSHVNRKVIKAYIMEEEGEGGIGEEAIVKPLALVSIL